MLVSFAESPPSHCGHLDQLDYCASHLLQVVAPVAVALGTEVESAPGALGLVFEKHSLVHVAEMALSVPSVSLLEKA